MRSSCASLPKNRPPACEANPKPLGINHSCLQAGRCDSYFAPLEAQSSRGTGMRLSKLHDDDITCTCDVRTVAIFSGLRRTLFLALLDVHERLQSLGYTPTCLYQQHRPYRRS